MKILIDIGHPAHVHYFKNFIWEMEKKGHEFLITARNRGIIFDLLKTYNFDYIDRGSGSTNMLGKILYMPKAKLIIYKIAKRFNPDLFLSTRSIYVSHISKLLGKRCIAFGDTEFIPKIEEILSGMFTDVICTPSCFEKDLGRKHIKFNGYLELCYLHPNYFNPDPSVLDELGVGKDEKYVIIRFIAWDASHDVGYTGFSNEEKRKIIKEIKKFALPIITSESFLPKEFKKYQIKIPPHRIHDAIYYASMYIGEGATMASEAALMGTPSVLVHPLAGILGTTKEQSEVHKILINMRDYNIKKLLKIVNENINKKNEWTRKKEKMLENKIDVTSFMVWLVENYPTSANKLKDDPNIQEKFK